MRRNPKKVRIETRGTTVAFGNFGLKVIAPGFIRSNHIEAARKVVARATAKTGKMWIRVFPDRPFTQKAAEVGMGKGKGDVQGYEVEVLPGRVLFEIDGVEDVAAQTALRKAGSKLPVKTKVVARI